MNAVPPSFIAAEAGADATGLRWIALGEAAGLVAALAGVEPAEADERDFPARLRDADAWRRTGAEQGVADIAAIMEPGIAALLAVHASGADSRPAALALWREFAAARTAVLALLPPAA
jgi:hypothetical protein